LYGCKTWSLSLREENRLKVFENRVLSGIFGSKRNEVRGEWRRLHGEELNDLHCSPCIVRVIKSRRTRWAGHVARVATGEGHIGFKLGDLRRRDHLVYLGVDGSIIQGYSK
jgi:hypothetical protein